MNYTIKTWLAKNHPEILAMWINYNYKTRREYQRKFAKEHYLKAVDKLSNTKL